MENIMIIISKLEKTTDQIDQIDLELHKTIMKTDFDITPLRNELKSIVKFRTLLLNDLLLRVNENKDFNTRESANSAEIILTLKKLGSINLNISLPTDKDSLFLINQIKKISNHSYRSLIYQLLSIIYSIRPDVFPINRNYKDSPMESSQLRHSLIQLDEDNIYLQDFIPLSDYVRIVFYKSTGVFPDYINIIDVRNEIEGAKESGLSALAYNFIVYNQRYSFVVFKGTGANIDYSEKSFTTKYDKIIWENYLDWRYNVNSILAGNDHSLEQIKQSLEFIEFLSDKLDPSTQIYGLGHSLGGNLVQSIQLITHKFDSVYNLNSAPIQLKQIRLIKPDLFTNEIWDRVLNATQIGGNSETVQKFKDITGLDFSEVRNDYIDHDLTQMFYRLPNTIWIGQKIDSKLPFEHPFKVDLYNFLTREEIQWLMKFETEMFKQLEESSNSVDVVRYFAAYIFSELRLLYNNLNDPYVYSAYTDFINYLYTSQLITVTPDEVTRDLSESMRKNVISQTLERTSYLKFLRSINPKTMELILYLHLSEGARFFVSNNKKS
ncbi:DUF6792 domain-containing protein [Companilactobacillus metriopterae]|uniref:DUF6792 domain-containing protein n=1 Tax=Companilactobacillus metriopterae TaxID=1909267 RepID=UPI00100B19B0|nr:DUF6792 domain-containing protein [Companilactobacillus metriopterae]